MEGHQHPGASSVEPGMIGSFFGIVMLAICYEAIKLLREGLMFKSLSNCQRTRSQKKYEVSHSHQNRDLLPSTTNYQDEPLQENSTEVVNNNQIFSIDHAAQTLLYILQVFISYLLMLTFMTYNVYLCAAVLIGCGLGYFMFGWRKRSMLDLGDHCG